MSGKKQYELPTLQGGAQACNMAPLLLFLRRKGFFSPPPSGAVEFPHIFKPGIIYGRYTRWLPVEARIHK